MMKNIYFQSLEPMARGQTVALDEVIDEIGFDHRGLVPVITQDAISKEVLMFAWMNKTSIEQTLVTGRMTYWSRSRNKLWIKGQTSGHFQSLESMRLDCDGDAILCLVKQKGAACHTGRKQCFYLEINPGHKTVSLLSSAPP